MTYNSTQPGELMIAADMKMMRMLIGCQSSAACHCFCPMCLVTRDDIALGCVHSPSLSSQYISRRRNRRLSFPPRTTASQHQQHNDFQAQAHGNLSKAKHYGNVIHPPLFSSEIHHHMAALPLHILLGTTKKAMDIIGESCDHLDKQLQQQHIVASSLTISPSRKHIRDSIRSASNNISWYGLCLQQCHEQQKQINPSSAAWSAYQQARDQFINKRKAEEKLLHDLEEKWYSSQGHFSRSLDDVITRLKVKRQRYHGGAFGE